MTSVAKGPPESIQPPIFSGQTSQRPQGESRALLALGILDHRMATRDRYEGAERESFIEQAITEASMALNGASIDDILGARL